MLRAGAIYLVLAAVFFSPLFPHFTTSLLGPPEDNMQDLWNTWHSQVALGSDPYQLFFRTHMLFFPEGTSLLHHSFSYPNLFAIWVVRSLLGWSLDLGVLVGLHNLMLLLSFPLAGLGAFLLTWQFTKRFVPALVGGYIFAFSPFHVAHAQHHLHVATIQFIPWFVLFAMRFVGQGTIGAYFGAVVCYALSALSSWYYLVYNTYFLALYYAYRMLTRRAVWLPRTAFRLSGLVAGAGVVLWPMLLPMARQAAGNPEVYRSGHDRFVADLAGFVVFHPAHWLAGWTQAINAQLQGNAWEATVYLGLVNLCVLGWGLWHHDRVPRAAGCAVGMACFMLLAAGQTLHVLGRTTGWSLPTVLTVHVSFLSNIRTPARAIVYAYLFLGVAVGCALQAMCFSAGAGRTWWQRSERVRHAVAGALVLLIVLDFFSVVRQMTPVALPPAYALIRDDADRPAAVLDLPDTYQVGNRAMLHQLFHRHPIVHASIARKPAPSLIDTLAFDDLAEQRRQLQEAGVRYIVVHKRLPAQAHPLDLAAYQAQYQMVFDDDEQAVFRTE